MAVSRNKEHELIMVCIYDALVYSSMNEEFNLEEIMEGVFEMPFDEISLFAKSVVVKSLKNINEIIPVFQKNMPKWDFSRLNNLEKSILIMSYTHYKEIGSVDKGVVIDLAVRLAKKYLDNADYKFINAILDNVL